jgi:hypothetical protein
MFDAIVPVVSGSVTGAGEASDGSVGATRRVLRCNPAFELLTVTTPVAVVLPTLPNPNFALVVDLTSYGRADAVTANARATMPTTTNDNSFRILTELLFDSWRIIFIDSCAPIGSNIESHQHPHFFYGHSQGNKCNSDAKYRRDSVFSIST